MAQVGWPVPHGWGLAELQVLGHPSLHSHWGWVSAGRVSGRDYCHPQRLMPDPGWELEAGRMEETCGRAGAE